MARVKCDEGYKKALGPHQHTRGPRVRMYAPKYGCNCQISSATRGLSDQETNVGGPRGGKGAPTSAAMVALTAGSSAWAKGCCGSTAVWACGAGAVKCKHNGQSRAWCPAGAASAPSSPTTTSFIALPVVQTSCSSCGCTMGDAMAAPMVTMNHARMRRPNNDDVRSVCMLRIITVIRRKLHSRFVCHQPWSMRQKCFSCRFAAKVSLGWQR